jgi:hypothetical protein
MQIFRGQFVSSCFAIISIRPIWPEWLPSSLTATRGELERATSRHWLIAETTPNR